jgi:hypothetical protein
MKKEIKNVIFVDGNKTTVKIFYDDHLEVRTWDPKDPDLKDWDEADIEMASHDFMNRELSISENFEKFMRGEGVLIGNHLALLLTKVLSKEELFELKVAILELEYVKASRKRSIKSQIRKSSDLMELFHLVYLLREDAKEKEEKEAAKAES